MTDTVGTVAFALRLAYRGLADEAQEALAELSDEQLRVARTQLLRIAAFTDTVRYERPTLPLGVDGFHIHGRKCRYCPADPCPDPDGHQRFDAGNELTWWRRAVAS